jgi:hypothetical protein
MTKQTLEKMDEMHHECINLIAKYASQLCTHNIGTVMIACSAHMLFQCAPDEKEANKVIRKAVKQGKFFHENHVKMFATKGGKDE